MHGSPIALTSVIPREPPQGASKTEAWGGSGQEDPATSACFNHSTCCSHWDGFQSQACAIQWKVWVALYSHVENITDSHPT